MRFEALQEFDRDLKKLSKCYRTLKSDLETVKKVLNVNPKARPPFSFNIEGLGISSCVIKVKKIACKSLKGKGVNTGLRLIYAYFEERVEAIAGIKTANLDEKIIFIELYHKSNKANENRERILKYFSS